MSKNFDPLLSLLNPCKNTFSVIAITETWFHKDIPFDLYNISGYTLIHRDRIDRNGGGVAMFVNNMFTFTVYDQISVTNYNSFEAMFINLCISQAKSVNIGVLYRPPHLSTSQFITDFNEMLSSYGYCSKTCYILGDLNINLMNVENDNQCADFMNVLYSYSLVPTVDIPTRISSTSATLIDNIITNDNYPMNSAIITMISVITYPFA
ncbi:hypothetical protein HOLleu_22055 [Holothuria leucospilota]|uniref:Uncharacterized protein n=1 Tax=Holothuria leucospilota TaxID=206669 RepID=A0A9Q1H4E3_HOLLE|nr:hypothetical protein HOLleu_22055 [Holothuria leucospilota]